MSRSRAAEVAVADGRAPPAWSAGALWPVATTGRAMNAVRRAAVTAFRKVRTHAFGTVRVDWPGWWALYTCRSPWNPSLRKASCASGEHREPILMLAGRVGRQTVGDDDQSPAGQQGFDGRGASSFGPPVSRPARVRLLTASGAAQCSRRSVPHGEYNAGAGRGISAGQARSTGHWCDMLRATRSARASVTVWPERSRVKNAPWLASSRPAVDSVIPRRSAYIRPSRTNWVEYMPP